ncbi:MAG: T9SS type A sorting domain-containing protein [Paludibacter sp.]
MKKIILLLAFVAFIVQSTFAWGWAVRDVTNQPSENPTYYLGDQVNLYWYVNSTGYGATYKKAGIGTTNSSAGMNWQNIVWNNDAGDGFGNNEGIKSATYTVNSVGTWYYSLWLGWGASIGDNGAYNNGSNVWTQGNTSFQSSSFTVNALGNPTSCTASITGTTASLGWTRFVGNAVNYNVMIVRYAKNATPTAPTNGSAYALNASIGSGTVVYATGSGTSTTNTVTAATDYDYYFYSENWSYYSSGVKVTAVAPAVPTITSISSSLPSFSSTQTYKGATVRVTGTNLSSVSSIKLGGSSGTSITTSSPTTISATDIFFVVPDGTSSGTVYVSDGTNSATSSGTLTNLGFISTINGNWSSTSTWLGGAVPTSSDNVSIAHSTAVSLDGDKTVANLTINNSTGNLNYNGSYTLTIAANGTFTNNGTFTRGTGTVNFAGAGTVNGTSVTTFKNLTINSGTLTLTTVPTIDGTFTINNGNISAAPKYTSNSTLYYNVGYNRYLEWSATGAGTLGTTAGYPNNVTVNNGTLTVVNGDAGTARAMAGNLVVNTGATFTTGALNAIVTIGGNLTTNGTGTVNMSSTNANVNVVGNVSNAGTITLSTATGRLKCNDFTNTGTVTLSSNVGGDLELTGSLVDNATFNANSRAVFFTGTGTQDVSGNGTFNIDYIVSNKSTGSIRMLCDLLCEGPNTGHALTLTNSTDILDLNGHVLTLGKAGIVSDISGSGSIKGSSTSSISILGNGAVGTLNLTSGSQTLNNLTIDRQSTGTITLGSPLTLSGQLTLTNGALNNSTNGITLGNGATIVRSAGTISAIPTFGSSVNLTYNGSSTKSIEFPATDIINTLIVNNTAGITLADNRNIPNLTIGTGSSLTVNVGKQLTVSTSMSNGGTLNLLSDATGTATIITPGTISGSGTASVQQYLTTGRNWYISSPVSEATSNVFSASSGNPLYWYDEAHGTSAPWATITNTSTLLNVMQGYVANIASSRVVTFSGALNNGDKSITVYRTVGQTKEGFNLVGNPYPSYLDWSNITKTNLMTTLWYRTKSAANAYVFDTYNASGSIGTSNGATTVTNLIPPMQAFWVRVNPGQTSGTLAVTNAQRAHTDISSNTFKAKASISAQSVLRLEVSNGVNSDQALVNFNSNASNGLDTYDSPKMTNASASIPEIYTLAEGEQVAINGVNDLSELALGFTTGEAGNFTIKASQFANFASGTQIILRDNLLNFEQDLTLADYNFYSDVTANNETRFTVLFKAPSVATGINQNSNGNVWISLANNQIVVNGANAGTSVAVYNEVGQRLASQTLTATTKVLNTKLASGIYMVTVTNAGKSVTTKVIIK